MPYRDPRCVFVAESIAMADLVAGWLEGHDIRAEVMNRNTRGGFEGLSLVSPNGVSSNGIEVWVLDPEQAQRAVELLAEKEMQKIARTAAKEASGEPIDVVCEECGETATFPPAQRGTVQNCPHCGEYIDVGEDEDEEEGDADAAEEEDDAPPSDGVRLPPRVRPESDE
jgi:hypothetical protein